MDKKKKKKARLHVVTDEMQVEETWGVAELKTLLKKARKRIKALEQQLEIVTSSNDILKEEHATISKKIDVLDTRTQRMGLALREIMSRLGIERQH